MKELYIIDRFESLKIDIFVNSFILNSLFIFVKLFIPFLLIFRIGFSIGTPISHTES